MRIGLVNLITKTADVQANASVLRSENLRPGTDRDLNIVETAKRLANRGHEVTIYVADTYRPEEAASFDGVRVRYIPTRLCWLFPPALAPLTPSLPWSIKSEELDVVQSGEVFQPGTLLAWSASRRRGQGQGLFIWQELDTYMRGPLGWAQKQFYATMGRGVVRGCRALIPRSRSARYHLLEAGVPERKIAPVVHSGVDTNVFRPMNKQESRERFDIEEDRNVIIAVGRLHENKGMDLLIRAMCRVRAGDPDCLLVVKGTGPQEGYLRSLVQKMGLADNVRIMTERLDLAGMAALYNSGDVLAVTSRIDLFPFTAIEAISCGVPVATSFPRGLKTDIVDQGAGVMISCYPDEMAADLLALLEDPVRLDRLGSKARDLARRDFDFEVSAERFLSIYAGSES